MPTKQRKHAVRTLREIRIELATAELRAAESQAIARRQITAIARDLLPKAASYARKGRPRLLAVCARIIGAPTLQANLKAAKLL